MVARERTDGAAGLGRRSVRDHATVRGAAASRLASRGTAARWVSATIVASVAGVLAAVALAPSPGARPGAALVALTFLGPAMHVGSTGWLATWPEARRCARRQPTRLVVAPLLVVTVAPLLMARLANQVLTPVVLAFFAWQLWHFAKQNLGLVALASTSLGAGPLRPAERRCLLGAGVCAVVALVARPSLLALDGVPSCPDLSLLAGIGLAGCAIAGTWATLRRRPAERPAGLCGLMAVALAFPVPLFLVASPYGAAGGLSVAHGLQYLVLLGTSAATADRARRVRRLTSLLVIAVAGGLALEATVRPVLEASGARLALGCYVGLVAAHFLVDAGLWRLRDADARGFVAAALPALVRTTGNHPPLDRPTI